MPSTHTCFYIAFRQNENRSLSVLRLAHRLPTGIEPFWTRRKQNTIPAFLNAKKTEHHPSIFPCKTFTKCCAVYPRPRMCSWHWLGTADRCQLRDADCIQTAPNMWNRNFHKGLISKPFQNERWHCTKPRLTSQLISFKRFGNQKRSDRRLIKDNSMTFSNLKFILHVFHVQSQIQSCILFKCLNMNIYTHTHIYI